MKTIFSLAGLILLTQTAAADAATLLCRLPDIFQGPQVKFEIFENKIGRSVYSQTGYLGEQVVATLPCKYEVNPPQSESKAVVVSCADSKVPGYIIKMVSGPMGLGLQAEVYEVSAGASAEKPLTLECRN